MLETFAMILRFTAWTALILFCMWFVWLMVCGKEALRQGLGASDDRPVDDAENDPDYCNKLHEDM